MATKPYTIPRANSPFSEGGGNPTREWYNYLLYVGNSSSGNADALLNDITIISEKLGSPDGTPENIPPLSEQTGRIVGQQSILSNGVLPGIVTLQLAGDEGTPGNTFYYGTSSEGTKGFYTIASAFLGSDGDITLAVGDDGVTTIDLADVSVGTGGSLKKYGFDPKGRLSEEDDATTDDLNEGATNLYFTDARAKAAAVADTINPAITDVAPSQHAVSVALDEKIDESEKGEPNGVATLDSNGKLDAGQLPDLAITQTFVVASQAAMLALDCQQGDVAVRTDLSESFILTADPPSTLANWQQLLTPTSPVTSVFGRTGSVTAATGDYTFSQIGSTPTTLSGYGITDAQPLDATLTALAGQNWSANAMPLGTGTDTVTQLSLGVNTFPARSSSGNVVAKPITDFAFSLIDDANATAALATLGTGTAALANVQTSVTDSTTNRVLVVGAFGLGSTSISSDWNSSANSTTFKSTNTNSPSPTNFYTGISIASPTSGYKMNFAARNGHFLFQTQEAGTWGSWIEPWTPDNDGSGSGLDADLLDGQDGAYYLSLANQTGTLTAQNGGTGQSSYAVGDLLYASTTTALSKLSDVASGNALISGGVGVAPSYGKIGLTTHVSGTLPIANGGTGQTTASAAFDALAPTTTSQDLIVRGASGNGRLGVGANGTVLTVTSGVVGWSAPATSGTVTSVGLSLPSIFTVSGSPVTSSGTLTGTLANQAANSVFAGPVSGSAAAPSFRALVSADVPLPTDYISGLKLIWNSATSISVGTGSAVIPSTGKLETVSATLTLSSLALSASTFYHVYLYDNAGTPTLECVTTAPAAPYQGTARAKTGDTTRRYLGSVLTDSSGNLVPFSHAGTTIFYDNGSVGAAPYRVLSNGTATTSTSVSLTGIVPVSAQSINANIINLASAGTLYVQRTTGTNKYAQIIPTTSSTLAYVNNIAVMPISGQAFGYFYDSAPIGGGAYIDVYAYTFAR